MLAHYNENLINLIERKLTLYKDNTIAKVAGKKEVKTRMFNQIEAIKDTLATMNIELRINYQDFTAIFHDLTNNSTQEIKAR